MKLQSLCLSDATFFQFIFSVWLDIVTNHNTCKYKSNPLSSTITTAVSCSKHS